MVPIRFLAADSSSITPTVGRSVRRSVGRSKNVKKVDSAPKNDPILMGDNSLKAYGHLVSFCEDFFLAPYFAPPQGGKNTPQNAPF